MMLGDTVERFEPTTSYCRRCGYEVPDEVMATPYLCEPCAFELEE